ncbi:MAG: alpha-ketoacid dehydrogenase subunit beta [Candidatus Thermoplasmatota archaeon]|nr:alpha-ketoacid dehydrogenase subunit beta [Candidatus Thermoplasmatota archaeon]
MNMVQAINSALKVEMERDPSVVVLGEDVGLNGGVFRATEGLQELLGEDRVMDTPLAESGIVGFSIGAALMGMRPVAEIQFMGFLWPAIDQLASHAGRLRNRTQGRFSVPMVVRFPYGGGVRALEHHAESYEATLAHIPGLKVVIPSTPYDAKGLLISSIRDPDPVIFMEPKKLYRAGKEEVPEGEYTEPIGKAKVLREGDDITLVGWGSLVPRLLKAARLIEDKGISAEVIDVRTISPYDEGTVHDSLEKTGRMLVAQEAHRNLGFASEIAARAQEKMMDVMEAPILRLTGFDVPFPFYRMENWAMPDIDRIIKGIREVLTW